MREVIEQGGKGALREARAGGGRLAVDQKCLGEARHIVQFGKLFGGDPRLGARHPIAVPRVADRGCEQHIERQAPALRLGDFERQHPAADRARHRERGQRSARRDRLVSKLAIEFPPCSRTGSARRHDGADTAGRFAHEPEGVAAHVVHVRIDDRDRRRHRDDRFDRVAALGDDVAPGFDCGLVRSRDDAAAMSGAEEFHGGANGPLCGGGRLRQFSDRWRRRQTALIRHGQRSSPLRNTFGNGCQF
jgi:hypothetical protein